MRRRVKQKVDEEKKINTATTAIGYFTFSNSF